MYVYVVAKLLFSCNILQYFICTVGNNCNAVDETFHD
jgi:hypothetical protein